MAEALDKYANDPELHLSFAPADVRTHFDGWGVDDLLDDMDDESMAQAAREVIWKDGALSDAMFNVFQTILTRAQSIQTARRN